VTLTIEADGHDQGKRPDLSALDQDFRVLGTSSGTQIQIINGRRSDTQRWTVVLEPKHMGELRVPPIEVGSEETRPLTLEVSEVPAQDAASGQAELFVEMETDTTRGFVQQQIPITVRLFSAVPIREGVLTEPKVENARVDQLGDNRRYMAERKGRRYQVIERKYVLFPERSGKLRVPPVVFRGSVVAKRGAGSGRGGGSLFERLRNDRSFSGAFSDPMLDRLFNDDFFQNPFGTPEPGERISARSRGLDIEVEPRPDDYRGKHWLPARQLTLEDSWAEEPPIFRVGEPVTRTITVRAQGAEGAQIPPLNLEPAEGLRVYPEQPVSETRTDGKRVFGISRQSMAIVPKKAGALVVPEIKVSWWDTDARRERITHIPAWRVTAEPGSGALPQQEPAPITAAPSTPHKTAAPEQTASAPEEQPTPHDVTAAHAYWPWLVGAGVLILASLTGWLGWRKARIKNAGPIAYPAKPDRQASRAGYRAAQGAFRQTCEANDAAGAASTLLAWAAEEWPDRPPRSLGAVAARVGQGADLIRELDRNLYASEAAQWRGESLWEALRGGLASDSRRRGAETGRPDLPPLYPSSLSDLGVRSEGKRDRVRLFDRLRRIAGSI
jgi:hypothetical protein